MSTCYVQKPERGGGETPPPSWNVELPGWRAHCDILAWALLRQCLSLTHYHKLVKFVSGILLSTPTLSGVIAVWLTGTVFVAPSQNSSLLFVLVLS